MGVPGQTPTVALMRESDGNFWTGSGFTSNFTTVSLLEIDSAHRPGYYSINFDQSIDNVADTYVAYYQNGGFLGETP